MSPLRAAWQDKNVIKVRVPVTLGRGFVVRRNTSGFCLLEMSHVLTRLLNTGVHTTVIFQ